MPLSRNGSTAVSMMLWAQSMELDYKTVRDQVIRVLKEDFGKGDNSIFAQVVGVQASFMPMDNGQLSLELSRIKL